MAMLPCMVNDGSQKIPLRYRWERTAGIDAHLKKWVGYDGERPIGFIHKSHMGGYQWYQTWESAAMGPALPATGGIEENANLAAVAVERTYDCILDGMRPDLSPRLIAVAQEAAATSWVRRSTRG